MFVGITLAALLVPVDTVRGLAIHRESAIFIASGRVLEGRVLVHCMDVLEGEGLIFQHTVGESVEARGAQVGHVVVLSHLVVELKYRVFLSWVEGPGLDLDGHHGLSIDDEASEARVGGKVGVGSHGTCPEVDTDRFA